MLGRVRARSEADAAHGALATIARRGGNAAPEAAERWLPDDVDAARARLADVLHEAAEVEERTRRRRARRRGGESCVADYTSLQLQRYGGYSAG